MADVPVTNTSSLWVALAPTPRDVVLGTATFLNHHEFLFSSGGRVRAIYKYVVHCDEWKAIIQYPTNTSNGLHQAVVDPPGNKLFLFPQRLQRVIVDLNKKKVTTFSGFRNIHAVGPLTSADGTLHMIGDQATHYAIAEGEG